MTDQRDVIALLKRTGSTLLAALLAAGLATGEAAAQGKAKSKAAEPPATEAAPAPVERPAPYDEQLIQLSEVLGSLQYLRNLCDSKGEPQWRGAMQKLLDNETASEPQRASRLTAAFNRGYRAFAALHVSCTQAALQAESQYRAEGATLAREITARYGN